MNHNNRCSKWFIATLMSVTLLLTSCSGFLDETSESNHVLRDFYRNKTELDAGLLGVYAQLRDLYKGQSLPVTIVGTDEIYANNQSGNQGTMDRYIHTPAHQSVANWYQAHYSIIQGANIVIEKAPTVPEISVSDMNKAIGEAKTIRAWAYFRLVQTLGGVPLVLTKTTNINLRLRRNSIQEVYEQIFDDLKFACGKNDDGTSVLPLSANTAHINHWTAKGMIAKVALTIGTSMQRRPQPIEEYQSMTYDPKDMYEMCLETCDEIIEKGGYTLMPDYRDIFRIPTKNCKESLWEIQFSSSPGLGSNWAKQFGVAQSGNSNAFAAYAMPGNGYYTVVPGFYKYFKLGDGRRTWSIADYKIQYTNLLPTGLMSLSNQNIAGTTPAIKYNLDSDDPTVLQKSLEGIEAANYLRISKFRCAIGNNPDLYWQEELAFDANNTPNNVVVSRYADILLMRIEADMLFNGTVSSTSLGIMNNQLLFRARGGDMEHLATLKELDAAWSEAKAALDADPADATAINNFNKQDSKWLNDYTSTTLTYDELLRQRACELCFEFHRWFDLCRTGKLHTLVKNRILSPSTYSKVDFKFDQHYLMPIPLHEIDLANDKTLFYQNPGY